jgi:predicted deacylase
VIALKIGTVEAGKTQKAFGMLDGPQTHGRFVVQVPLHIVCGAADGAVLVIQAGVSGLEIEPSMVLPHVVDELDPAQVTGTLIVVPLLNTSGFEFEQKNAIWDDRDLNALGRGSADGTVSEQLVYQYFRQVVEPADALVDIRTGGRWGYYRYAGVYNVGSKDRSRAMAIALGLPQVLMGQPEDQSIAYEAARSGKAVVSAWIGGGPGLRDYRQEDMARVRRAVLNAMRHLGMLKDSIESDDGAVMEIECHTVVRVKGERGLTFMAKEKRGRMVRPGERIGYVRHPFTGDVVEEFTAPRGGIMLHAGAVWPMVPEGATLAILGDKIADHRV